jgi:hypothetical protein
VIVHVIVYIARADKHGERPVTRQQFAERVAMGRAIGRVKGDRHGVWRNRLGAVQGSEQASQWPDCKRLVGEVVQVLGTALRRDVPPGAVFEVGVLRPG